MRRFIACLLFAALLVASPTAPPALAGPGGEVVEEVTVKLVDVDRKQVRLRLDNGVDVYTTDVRYLDGLKPGDKVRVRYEVHSGRNLIVRIEPADR